MRFVAMSAHVFSQEVEFYLASGMDSYVAKPLLPEALAAALARAFEPHTADVTIDRAAWHADLASLGIEQMQRILGLSAAVLPERFAEMQAALAAGDLGRLRAVAHAGFSAASAAGFIRLQDCFRDIEVAAKQGDAAACGKLVDSVPSLVAEALAEAETLLSAANSAREEPQTDSLLRAT